MPLTAQTDLTTGSNPKGRTKTLNKNICNKNIILEYSRPNVVGNLLKNDLLWNLKIIYKHKQNGVALWNNIVPHQKLALARETGTGWQTSPEKKNRKFILIYGKENEELYSAKTHTTTKVESVFYLDYNS